MPRINFSIPFLIKHISLLLFQIKLVFSSTIFYET